MNPWRWVDPRIKAVRLADVERYLNQKGWILKPNPNPGLLRFELPAVGKGRPLYQMFPSSDQFDDFPQRVTELITTLSELEDRHPVEVLNDMLACEPPLGENGIETGTPKKAVGK